ncbi:MFS transporter [Fodinicola feengrottensis]|uniref:MFS transporter n=1 Tax=Fodinicola feengrottensis TaxID=435914 RepID=UPI0013D527FB|nr:MFS transporter [Fodinicola feengrottensis]
MISTEPRKLGRRDLVRSQTAWMLTLFFGSLSAIAYIGFGWMAPYMGAHGISAATAGAMVAVMTGVSIPVAMGIPIIPRARHRTVIVARSSPASRRRSWAWASRRLAVHGCGWCSSGWAPDCSRSV